MATRNPPQSARRSGSSDARARAIEEFVARFAPSDDADLLSEMMVTICRLARDGCGRGELKILNTALKELRYGFKVFAPWADVPKA